MKKRNLEKIEAMARASNDEPPKWERGEAATHLRELIARAGRGELPKVMPATEEKKSETWLEIEVAKVVKRIRHREQSEGAKVMVRDQRTMTEAKLTGADDELPVELLVRLSRVVSQKVH